MIGEVPGPETMADDEFVADWGHPPHAHTYHQFLFVPLGWITVTAQGREHRLSASVALWIPAGIAHSARFGEDSMIVSESFDAERYRLPYTEVTGVNVTDAQRRMLLSRTRRSVLSDDAFAFASLSAATRASLPLPQPSSPLAATVARELGRRPDDPRTVTEWALSLHTSSTSLRRAFRAETGLAFSEWRTRLRLNHSLDLLQRGHLVGAVAAMVGFSSVNGYIMAFRRHFGQTPGAYARKSA
ncbi:AraC family transcriptional regulator [Streptosporangium sp. NPDC020145]|uniref:helix-turn-helix transcriptional regulator n=1 Tax=Streptosporangium sp. NPDC020145 TaxID=3154694 RepID=UPI00342725DE